jgi:hypothetical protein
VPPDDLPLASSNFDPRSISVFQRGYCKPEELEEAEREGGEMFDSSESGGMGEGQGTTDVSDQIESQEQVHL